MENQNQVKSLYAKYKSFNASKAGKIFNAVVATVFIGIWVNNELEIIEFKKEPKPYAQQTMFTKSETGNVSDDKIWAALVKAEPMLDKAAESEKMILVAAMRMSDAQFKEELTASGIGQVEADAYKKLRAYIHEIYPGVNGSVNNQDIFDIGLEVDVQQATEELGLNEPTTVNFSVDGQNHSVTVSGVENNTQPVQSAQPTQTQQVVENNGIKTITIEDDYSLSFLMPKVFENYNFNMDPEHRDALEFMVRQKRFDRETIDILVDNFGLMDKSVADAIVKGKDEIARILPGATGTSTLEDVLKSLGYSKDTGEFETKLEFVLDSNGNIIQKKYLDKMNAELTSKQTSSVPVQETAVESPVVSETSVAYEDTVAEKPVSEMDVEKPTDIDGTGYSRITFWSKNNYENNYLSMDISTKINPTNPVLNFNIQTQYLPSDDAELVVTLNTDNDKCYGVGKMNHLSTGMVESWELKLTKACVGATVKSAGIELIDPVSKDRNYHHFEVIGNTVI